MLRRIACAFTVALIALAPLGARAQSVPGLQLSVQPLIVQFAIAPGQQASAHVIVKNTGTQTARVSANQIDWIPNVDGSVKTGKPGLTGSSSLDPFLHLSGNEFTLAPGQTQEMTLTLDLPSTFSPAIGDHWGGYFIRAASAEGPVGSFGVGANILTYETVGHARKHLKLTSMRVEDAGNGNVRLVARMANDGQTYVRPQIHLQIAQAGRIVQARDDSTPAIFAESPRLYTRTFSGLTPGEYALELTIDYGGSTLVAGTTQFTVR
ncbi:MAG TPA: hypothetical protein VMD07_03040 [Candidatus Acidoferrales bacterium]|nr:hypothetical protein [Candidatus Acidoferrales bacterium]